MYTVSRFRTAPLPTSALAGCGTTEQAQRQLQQPLAQGQSIAAALQPELDIELQVMLAMLNGEPAKSSSS